MLFYHKYNTHTYIIIYFIYYFSSGIQIIETGIGSSMSTIVEQFATFLASFVIAFVINWELSLVTCTILPVMFITIYIAEKVNCTDSISIIIINNYYVSNIHVDHGEGCYKAAKCTCNGWISS